jgi:hypothetical protein
MNKDAKNKNNSIKQPKSKHKRKYVQHIKRYKSAYFVWLTTVGRPKIVNENPNVKLRIGTITKQAGLIWSNMNDEEKLPFIKKSLEEKEN